MDSLFALLATRGDSGVLIAVVEPTRAAPAHPVELERDRDPAPLGVRGVEFGAFLQRPDYLDVVVNHEPFMLETSRRFESHHVLRHHGTSLELACQFPGGSTSSASKGIGAMTSTRRVTAAQIGPGTPFRFDVTIIDETAESSGPRAPLAVTSHTQASTHYEMPATGACRELPH